MLSLLHFFVSLGIDGGDVGMSGDYDNMVKDKVKTAEYAMAFNKRADNRTTFRLSPLTSRQAEPYCQWHTPPRYGCGYKKLYISSGTENDRHRRTY